jgi:hypothetical protein
VRNIILAFPDGAMNEKLRKILLSVGLQVAGEVGSRPQLLQAATRLEGGGVVILPARLTGFPSATLTSDLSDEYDLLILLSGDQAWDNSRAGVFALRTPIRPIELTDSVRMLLETRQLVSPIRRHPPLAHQPYAAAPPGEEKKEPKPSSRTQEDRKLIDQAKQVLIVRNSMSEEQAHRFLQKRSMDSGNPLVAVARQILDT